MSYTINLTNGSVLTTVLDGTIDSTTGLALIGRNYINYGVLQNDNFVRLLENFANNVPPTQISGAVSVLTGTLWYDTANNLLKVYDGQNFNPVSQRIVSATIPQAKNIGDQWWDSTNQQLYSWSGNTWLLVGPAYSFGQGKSGSLVETIKDLTNQQHTVVNTYTNGNLILTASHDNFSANGYNNLTQVTNGLNLQGNLAITQNLTVNNNLSATNGTINGQLALNNLTGNNLVLYPMRTNLFDIGSPSAQFRNFYIGQNLVFLNNANIYYSTASQAITAQNFITGGNLDVIVNSVPYGTVTALHVSGQTGKVSVLGDPINPNNVATKNYVDTGIYNVNQYVSTEVNSLTAEISTVNQQLSSSLISNISALSTDLNNTSVSLQSDYNLKFSQEVINRNSNIAIAVAPLAPINSPAFTGTPTAPTPAFGDNSTNIATTAFIHTVTQNLGTLSTQNYDNVNITGGNIAVTSLHTTSATVTNLLTTSGSFTNQVTAPTVAVGDNSTNVATTGFVYSVTGNLGTLSQQNANNVHITGGTITGISNLSANSLNNAGGWSIIPSGNKLYFNFNGVNVASLDSAGNWITAQNMTAFGTP